MPEAGDQGSLLWPGPWSQQPPEEDGCLGELRSVAKDLWRDEAKGEGPWCGGSAPGEFWCPPSPRQEGLTAHFSVSLHLALSG